MVEEKVSLKLRLGTRKSKLALWQANFVKSKLEALGLEIELVLITTTGDKY
jgi:hydroxymethylbilane synthase (EC 2.5.1.61)